MKTTLLWWRQAVQSTVRRRCPKLLHSTMGCSKIPRQVSVQFSCFRSTTVDLFVVVQSRLCGEDMLLRAFPWYAGDMCEMHEMKRAYFS